MLVAANLVFWGWRLATSALDDPLPGLPATMLWVWERQEDLSFLDCDSVVVAYFAETIFAYRFSPRFQMDRYAAGDLGVVFPQFGRRYLFVAYRNFFGTPLTALQLLHRNYPKSEWTRKSPYWYR